MPIIQVHMVEGRPAERKEELITALTEGASVITAAVPKRLSGFFDSFASFAGDNSLTSFPYAE